MKKFLLILIIGIVSNPLLWASGPQLDDLVRHVVERNPRIQESYRSWQVLEDQVTPTGAWPNPHLNLSREKESGMDPMRINKIGVSQEIPFPGKLTYDEKMKQHEAWMAQSLYQDTVLDVVSELKQRFYQLLLIDQLIDLGGQGVINFQQAKASAEARVASGQASVSDVLTAQMDLQKMENMVYEQKQQRSLVQAELNTLLNNPLDDSWETPASPPTIPITFTATQMEKLAETSSPMIRAAQHEAHHGTYMLKRSRLDFVPDVEVMAEKMSPDHGEEGHEVGLSLSIPLWFQRPWKNAAAAKEHVLQTKAGSIERQNVVKRMVRTEYIQSQTYDTLADHYKTGILPPAESNVTLMKEAYAAGKTDFFHLTQAIQMWIEANIQYQNQLYAAAEHRSLLERWVGMSLKEAQKIFEEENNAK